MKKINLELTKFEAKALYDLISSELGNLDTGDEQFERAISRIDKKLFALLN